MGSIKTRARGRRRQRAVFPEMNFFMFMHTEWNLDLRNIVLGNILKSLI